jgi:2'-5' RNA ligase
MAESYRLALAPLEVLDPVPNQWLHLTLQGVGFVDEVKRSTVDEIVAAAAGHLAGVEPFELRFGRPQVEPEAVCCFFDPASPAAVRGAIRAGIGEVLPEAPGPADGFRPHVSLAYSNGEGPAAPIDEALDSVAPESAGAHIGSAELIILNRDNQQYEWETYASVPLGSRA